MSLVFGILKEEEKRLKKLVADCDKALKVLPKESVHIREINGNSYLYSIKRKYNKVISCYIGKSSDESNQKRIEQDKKRRIYKQRKKEALIGIKEVRRALGREITK